eukprot:5080935-Prymnesium_polylepis.1
MARNDHLLPRQRAAGAYASAAHASAGAQSYVPRGTWAITGGGAHRQVICPDMTPCPCAGRCLQAALL